MTETTWPPPSAKPLSSLPLSQTAAGCVIKGMVGVMKRIKEIRKEGYNKEGKYEYLALADVLANLQDALVQEGLVIAQRETGRTIVNKILMIAYVFDVYHQDGECIFNIGSHTGACRFEFKSGATDDKAANKAMVNALKYFVLGLFKIPSDDHRTERLSDGEADAQGPNDPPPDERDDRRERRDNRRDDRRDDGFRRPDEPTPPWDGPPPDDAPPYEPPREDAPRRPPADESPAQAAHREQVMGFRHRFLHAQNSDDADAIWRDEAELLQRCASTTYEYLRGSYEKHWLINPPAT